MPAKSKKVAKGSVSISAKKKSVLIVEDDESLYEILRSIIKPRNYFVTGAFDLDEATQEINRQGFDFILLDMHLGEESGERLIEPIRASTYNRDAKILVISGHLDRELTKRIAPKIQGALVKPFDEAAVLKVLQKLND